MTAARSYLSLIQLAVFGRYVDSLRLRIAELTFKMRAGQGRWAL